MEEFETKSDTERTVFDKNAEEELVEQLEDFETLRDNQSDNEDMEDIEITLNSEINKENDRPKNVFRKNPSIRKI
jgi:hypothetical protein